VEKGQKRDGKKFKSDRASVHAGVRVASPKPTAMGKPVESPRDAVTEAVVVIWLVNQATDKGNNSQKEKRGREEAA
jgi:hypothetical protein